MMMAKHNAPQLQEPVITPWQGFPDPWKDYESLGATDAELDALATQVAQMTRVADADEVHVIRSLFEQLEARDRRAVRDKALAAGANPVMLQRALAGLPMYDFRPSKLHLALVTVSSGASAYHGYKRNDSIGWALVWAFFGGVAPILTPVIAVAQGFGKPKGS